jgi:hypothetical protein
MNAHFETPDRFSATGVTTAAILVVMPAMAASTLFTPEASNPTAAASASHLVDVHHASRDKAS